MDVSLLPSMGMQGYYGGAGGGDHGGWYQYQQMAAAFPVLPLCSSSSSSSPPPPPLMTSEQYSCLPIAAALPGDDGGALVDCSSALLPREEDMSAGYLPMIAAPAAACDLYGYSPDTLPPLPADLSTADLDNALLMQPLSFSDIDLEAFADVDDPKDEPLDTEAVVPLDHYLGALHHSCHTETVNHAARGIRVHDHRSSNSNAVVVSVYETAVEYAPKQEQQQARPAVALDHYLGALHHPCPTETVNHAARGIRVHNHRSSNSNAVVVSGYETAVEYAPKQEQQQARPAVARLARRSGGDGSTAAPAGVRSLNHIGFQELRKYFYMPITKAAREMNVGLTVLKKRCRELGVARWPHRKMKSLKSLILNIQEMGMSSAAVHRELEALERYCSRMEENPAIELTEQTKKLRQACFKENYKRRRAAAVTMMDHCYNGDFGRDHQQLRLPPPHKISRQSQSSGFFG